MPKNLLVQRLLGAVREAPIDYRKGFRQLVSGDYRGRQKQPDTRRMVPAVVEH
jgi:hypothetical protein